MARERERERVEELVPRIDAEMARMTEELALVQEQIEAIPSPEELQRQAAERRQLMDAQLIAIKKRMPHLQQAARDRATRTETRKVREGVG